jgi:hypothetical protein
MNRSLFNGIIVTALFSILMANTAFAEPFYKGKKLRVTITNITKAQIFSPPIVITHNDNFTLFELGEPASPELALLAEDGDSSLLIGEVSASPDVHAYVVADGPVLPGKSLTIDVDVDRSFRLVSLAGMLVTTNDAFVAVHSERIPLGLKHLKAAAYDAGSEVNSEDCGFIPGPPCGNGGVRDTVGAEGFVHIHSGIHGVGDLLTYRDDWRNPVAEITMQLINE